jgi:hypothetical protein
LKTYYELLGVAATADFDEIKHAFRKEIARYHPDKVQHLGMEFQEIASARAAELTEAYRVLMDEAARRKYDDSLASSGPAPRQGPPRPPAETRGPRPAPAAGPREPEPAGVDRRFHEARATTNEFVKKAALAMLREAVGAVADSARPAAVRGFDAAFLLKGKRAMFGKGEPEVQLLARFVPEVNVDAVDQSWPLAVSAGTMTDHTTCVLLLGAGLAPAKELSGAIGAQRRRTRRGCPVLVPVDVRDWEALFPADAPASVRAIVQRLREGKR